MIVRQQSHLYYATRDYLRSLDPHLGNRALAQLTRALIAAGLVREVRQIVDRDGEVIR